MEPRTFHNTIGETGHTLARSKIQAGTQQDKILKFFQDWPDKWFTPFTVQSSVLPGSPITSVRRAMTNLEQAGYLVKSTSANGRGGYGKANHTWALKSREQVQQQLW